MSFPMNKADHAGGLSSRDHEPSTCAATPQSAAPEQTMIEHICRRMAARRGYDPDALMHRGAAYQVEGGYVPCTEAMPIWQSFSADARAAVEATRDYLEEQSDRYVAAMIDAALSNGSPLTTTNGNSGKQNNTTKERT